MWSCNEHTHTEDTTSCTLVPMFVEVIVSLFLDISHNMPYWYTLDVCYIYYMKLSGNLTPTDLCNARNIEAPTFVVLSCTILPLPPFCFVNRELVGNSIVIAPCPGKIVTDIPRLLIDLNFLCWCKTWKHCVTLQRCKKCICTCMQFDAGLGHC